MAAIERFALAPDLTICRILNGMWQVSGGHGPIEPATAVRSMIDLFDAGFTTFDLADHYGPAEDFIGELALDLSAKPEQKPKNVLVPSTLVVRESTVRGSGRGT